MLAPSTDQPHLLEARIDVFSLLGGLPKAWRFDRIATICNRTPAT